MDASFIFRNWKWAFLYEKRESCDWRFIYLKFYIRHISFLYAYWDQSSLLHRAYEFNLRRYFPDERFKLTFSFEQFDPCKMLLEARAQFFPHPHLGSHTGPREKGPLRGGPSSKGYCLKIRCACCASPNLTHVHCERRYAKDERDSMHIHQIL